MSTFVRLAVRDDRERSFEPRSLVRPKLQRGFAGGFTQRRQKSHSGSQNEARQNRYAAWPVNPPQRSCIIRRIIAFALV
jgi:hypothetical protein